MSLSLLDFGYIALGCLILLRAILLRFILFGVNRGGSILLLLFDVAIFLSHSFYVARCCCFGCVV